MATPNWGAFEVRHRRMSSSVDVFKGEVTELGSLVNVFAFLSDRGIWLYWVYRYCIHRCSRLWLKVSKMWLDLGVARLATSIDQNNQHLKSQQEPLPVNRRPHW